MQPEAPAHREDALKHESGVSHGRIAAWAATHTASALKIIYLAAFLGFIIPVAVLRKPALLGVLLGFMLMRAAVYAAERLSETVLVQKIQSGLFHEALVSPGVSHARQLQILRRMISGHDGRELVEEGTSFISFALEMERNDLTPLLRAFEDHWGLPPEEGPDDGVIRQLLISGFRFSSTQSASAPTPPARRSDIEFGSLWREGRWRELRARYPGEPLGRLLLRLYATEWQQLLAPLWVLSTLIALALLAGPWFGIRVRGMLFYVVFVVQAVVAAWLAFVLRPAAFNASLMCGDLERCAHWVLESTEGKHFLVAALSSSRAAVRRQAISLLLWNDLLLQASLTLPEGMRGFLRREGSGPAVLSAREPAAAAS